MNKTSMRFVGIGLMSLVLALILFPNGPAISENRVSDFGREQSKQPFHSENSGIGIRIAAPTEKVTPSSKQKNVEELPQAHPNYSPVVSATSSYVSPASVFYQLQEGQGTLDIAASGALHRTNEGCLTWTFTREQGNSYPVVVLKMPNVASGEALWPIEKEIMVGGWLGMVADGQELTGQVGCMYETSEVFWLTGVVKG
ncbi:MAG: hypothetical protein RL488_278 [Actinomycetota bacterium]|jgi:hypothetical protein